MSEAISKRLSYVLRHRPDAIGLALDPAGWASVDELLAALARHGTALSRAELAAIVDASDKRRFALSADGARIRAQQGHSVPVELGHAEAADAGDGGARAADHASRARLTGAAR